MEDAGDEDQGEIRAVAVPFGGLVEDVARGAREATNCYGELGAPVAIGDFAGFLD